ncbi:hypothetical protein ES703_15607 [subsurface metagenome]
MPRKLFDIDVDEITLCGSASNRKKFFIRKQEKKMDEFIEELKKFMAEDDEDIEGALEKEDIEKAEKVPDAVMKAIKGALNILNKYKKDMPDDLLAVIKTLAKYATYGYPAKKEDLEKAGAKLSKTTRDQLAKILAFLKESPKAINMLKTLLGQEVEKAKGGEDGDEKLSEETLTKLEKLAEFEQAEKERIEKEEKEEAEKKKKDDEDVLERLEALEKKKGIKKSIDDPNEGDKKKVKKGADDDEDEDQWPSVYVPGLPESED